MRTLLLALLIAAAPPPSAQKAKELAARRAWEELYLAFAAGDVAGVPEAQRRTISGALLKGCEALLVEDAVMAYSLSERAVVFDASAGALKCLARSARKTDQRAAAEAALRKGLERHPKDGAFGLELGKLLLEEQDAAGALTVLEKVPPRSREGAEAKRLAQQARAQANEEGAARQEAERIEKLMHGKPGARRRSTSAPPDVRTAEGRDGPSDTRAVSLSYESSTDSLGMRTRSNGRFVIRYFNNERDFSQRAEYEGRVVDALEEAYAFTRSFLGEARESPVDVVLYTRDEFRFHYGPAKAQGLAGLYADDAIRINDAEELTQQTRATLVHEYVHAVLDDFCEKRGHQLPTWLNEGMAEFVEWRYLGRDDQVWFLQDALMGAARANKLPSLAAMADRKVFYTHEHYAYAKAAVAVKELIARGGTGRLLTFTREVCGGSPLDEELREHYGKTLAALDEDVRNTIMNSRK
ncbi:hypothetical protein HPC49_37750 [Pyxidicoccus fallax]|uniref:Peptidase MA-like domain-containing protein n=1 Tax=Pyxidicoccus fallax TaxID=394095 RepID=A0A848LX48_9BACT|nr:tetratricopeptide repeat protein [Pyxidicoccus fallax]NMO22209.1 hypothetical protein [Pyxidicoccus fallax]NPC83946.1 hypothetical protein [Pyxidicoccus fallax]